MSLNNKLVPKALQVAPSSTKPAAGRTRSGRRKRLFIQGPIDYEWLRRANKLGGCVGKVAVALWYFRGVTKSDRFKLTGQIDKLAEVCRQTRQGALKRLSEAGLIKLQTPSGALPTVEMLFPSEGAN